MGITFSKRSNRKRVVEPIFVKNRQKYRGYRSSVSENNEMNSLIVDLERITLQLDEINNLIDEQSIRIVGRISAATVEEKLQDGTTQTISGVEICYDDSSPELEDLVIPNLATLASKIARLELKIQKMEDTV
jgi:hypothetical protein